MANSPLHRAFIHQAEACASLGSPFMERVCSLVGKNLPVKGRVWEKIRGWHGDVSPYGDSVPLRLAGALHGLVLDMRDEGLTAVYPPHHDVATDEQLWSAILSATENHGDYILERLKSAPQTNEVRRSGVLLPGFLEIARLTGQNNFVMSELGASAGLNMYWDKYFYRFGGIEWGSREAKTRLSPKVTGSLPGSVNLDVVSRAGCDLNPIDLSSEEQQNLLMSYIWPDQEERMRRTVSAISVAVENSVSVERSDAVDWLQRRLQHRYEGSVHVIYHTIAWQYFPESKRAEGEEFLKRAGAHATKESPIAWLRLEADGKTPGAGLALTLWPSGETRTLARGDFHGRWLEWLI